jgi:hypothetical protein
MGTLQEDLSTFLIISHSILRMSSVTDKSYRENQNTHFMFSKFFFSKNCALYDIMWKKNCGARQATGDYIIEHMHIGCWITKATDTLSICNTCSFPTATMVTRMHLSVILYVHRLSCLMCYTGHPKYSAARHRIVRKELNVIKIVVENQLCYVLCNFLGVWFDISFVPQVTK